MTKTQRALIKKYKFKTHADFMRSLRDLFAKSKKESDARWEIQKEKYRLERLAWRKELMKKYPTLFPPNYIWPKS